MSKIIKVSLIFLFTILGGIICFVLLFKFLYGPKDLDIIKKYSEINDLDSAFVCAVIKTESGFNPNATSNKSASGYMQIIEKTATWGSNELAMDNFSYENIHEPETNIQIGTWYLRTLLNQFQVQDTALAAYNAGSGTVENWLQDKNYSDDGITLKEIPYGETKRYVEKVNKNYKIYKIYFNLKGY